MKQFSYMQLNSSESDKLKRMQGFLRFFAGCTDVLDIGCGRGEFLTVLAQNGVRGFGIDIDPACVARCESKGLESEEIGALDYLSTTERDFDGILCSHIVEHLPPDDAQNLLSCCYQVLRPRGVLVILTPNPRSIRVMHDMFWQDPTHVRPYPAVLLGLMLGTAGFAVEHESEDRKPRIRGIKGILTRYLLAEYFGWNDLLTVA